jgi:D-alanyl-D-alanine carboxypeptidase (penicillin-binding protein 5/6)
MRGREDASAALLNYGFNFYDTKLVVKGGSAIASSPVWKARDQAVDVGIKDDLYVTVPRGESNDIKTAVTLQPRLIAPLGLADEVGTLRVFTGTQTLATLPVHPLKADAAGSWWRRLIDTIRLWFH